MPSYATSATDTDEWYASPARMVALAAASTPPLHGVGGQADLR